jgi:N-acetyl-anhydromuramyl-L-alanine amidase AmpD
MNWFMTIKDKLNNKVIPVIEKEEPKKRGRKPLSETEKKIIVKKDSIKSPEKGGKKTHLAKKKIDILKEEPKKRGRKPLNKTKSDNSKILKEVKNIKNNKWSDLKIVDKSKIVNVNFYNKYFKEETEKNQIIIHDTISGSGIRGDFETYINNPLKTSVHIIIDRNGVIYQLFSSKYWSHHLDIQGQIFYNLGFNDSAIRNTILNKNSISVELDNWGGLNKVFTNKYMTEYGNIVTIDDNKVRLYPNKFKDYEYYESYTNEQLKSLGELLLYWNNIYNIPLDYKGYNMFDVNINALSGESGIWSYSSYRKDKSDCHPDPNLISLLKTINSLK